MTEAVQPKGTPSGRDIVQMSSETQLRQIAAKLREVTDATEVAATGIADGIGRWIGLVDQLEGLDASGNLEAEAVRAQLRDELRQAQAALQFQDITAQQLGYAASLLADVEERMQGLASVLGADGATESATRAEATALSEHWAFDSNATMHDASGRQALADSIFTAPK
jgi:hypothetical protein